MNEIPFVVRPIKVNEENKYIITVGMYKAYNGTFNSQEEAENALKEIIKDISNECWQLIASLCMACIDAKELEKKAIENQSKNEE